MEGDASVELLARLRPLRWLGRTLRALRAQHFVGTIYGAVSRKRGLLGRLVPDAPGPRRPP